jgi:signal peptidase II
MARKKQTQNYWTKILYLFVIFSGLVFGICYLSDYIINDINDGLISSNQFFLLTYTKNTGAAFSLLQDYPFLLIALSVTAIVLLFSFIIKHAATMSYIGIFWLSLLLAGIFCNLYERVQFGFVRDFIQLKFVNFPIFNLSDLAITISVTAIIILLLKRAQLKQL